MLALQIDGTAVLVPVKVTPGAARTRVIGILGRRLKIAVAAAPEKGRANDELVAFFARTLGVRRRDVQIESGRTSPLKTVRIEGVTVEAVQAAMLPARP